MMKCQVRILPFGQVTITIGSLQLKEDGSEVRSQNEPRYFIPRETASGTYEVLYDRESTTYPNVE